MKVSVLGAAGGIGQALALLLKNNLPDYSTLSLYDIASVTPGVAKDLSHIPNKVKVEGFCGEDPSDAIKDSNIILISAGVARKPGMDRSDLFNINAGIIKSLTEKIAIANPNAFIGIITNPVNTTVPIAAEVLKQKGVYDSRKLFGITTLDVIRAETFVSELKGYNNKDIAVPVIGGHSGITILPLLSQVKDITFTEEEVKNLTFRIQNAGTEVVEAKAGGGSATLSMGYAAYRFTMSLIDALNGKKEVIDYAYVDTSDSDNIPFFARPVLLSVNGIESHLPLGDLSPYESDMLDNMKETLNNDIDKGVSFINSNT
ncbi:malate dehydrogenase [Paraphotobacterium marinum]|uniref:Malate dehydrogenase n=1 Tax=Paraphotobacterium marinum TaxID=1755811 RepID=A0A220VD61_9GAMM|nr:malate dehydrogenase [Paraphotobacterium marinum]ASK78279.1 malate dehydrogenase [Paraphotobacterium marinum]